MRRMIFMTSCFILISASIYSQAKSSTQNSLIFTTGVGLRITPVYLGEIETAPGFSFSVPTDQLVTGPALHAGVMYYWRKSRIGVEYANSFRYHYYYLNFGDHAGFRLTSDFHFTINKFFPLKKNMLKMGIGHSFLDRGSKITYPYQEVVFGGDTVTYSRILSLAYGTFNFGIGYQAKQLSFELINRFTTDYYPDNGPMYIPELRLSYSFKMKNNKIFE